MISFIYSLDIINAVVPNPNIFFWIAASVEDTTVVDPNDIKMLLANGLSEFPFKGNPDFSNDPKRLPKNPPDSTILCNWSFDDFVFDNQIYF